MSASAAVPHAHSFLGADHDRNARKVWLVIALTATMMVAEIVAGTLFGSMALVADGWHMSTHAGAMLIAALAYGFARRHASDPAFTFGTGKIGDLAGFASAVVLALVALLIGWESLVRLTAPVPIDFDQAIAVAVVGLMVNLASAWLLKDDHAHHHHHGHDHAHHHHDPASHDHDHDHDHEGPARDNNLRAAYLHVLADALTSVLAIAALVLGRLYGWLWPDPVMGVVGALVIARWSIGLMRDSGAVLTDRTPDHGALVTRIRTLLETGGDQVSDVHVWQIGPGHYAAIVALSSASGAAPESYKARLSDVPALSHVTVEVNPA
ncbi:CDF family Co(II)/Ni(II) efflux transporter DmeF [Segnochrobactraceae bacterium EtOH-i3]